MTIKWLKLCTIIIMMLVIGSLFISSTQIKICSSKISLNDFDQEIFLVSTNVTNNDTNNLPKVMINILNPVTISFFAFIFAIISFILTYRQNRKLASEKSGRIRSQDCSNLP